MKKIILAILILGIVCVMVACKSNTADKGADAGQTAAEASETAETAAYEPMETQDNLTINLEEDQEGAVSPD